jgi:hypothetical protein
VLLEVEIIMSSNTELEQLNDFESATEDEAGPDFETEALVAAPRPSVCFY